WFKDKVNLDTRDYGQKFKETYNTELEDICQKIHNSKSYEDIKMFVNNYIAQIDGIDGVDYQLNDKDNSIAENFTLFREIIENVLNTEKNNISKGSGRYRLKNELLLNLSDDKLIMEKLGCTESCYCHQPRGLGGTHYLETNKLVAASCHERINKNGIRFNGLNKEWGDVKSQDFPNWSFESHYSNWNFESHYMSAFDNLMRWFFRMLHKDLAKSQELNAADESELEKKWLFKK
ncbi:12028_t:CDS:2, partial [Racocetra persica]